MSNRSDRAQCVSCAPHFTIFAASSSFIKIDKSLMLQRFGIPLKFTTTHFTMYNFLTKFFGFSAKKYACIGVSQSFDLILKLL